MSIYPEWMVIGQWVIYGFLSLFGFVGLFGFVDIFITRGWLGWKLGIHERFD